MTFSSSGYEDLRGYVKNNWNYIAVLDKTGTEQLRWDILNNGNVTITSDETGNPLTVELEITGQDIQDAGGSIPVTLTETQAYQGSATSTPMGSDTMTDGSLEASGDTVTVTHNYELPEI